MYPRRRALVRPASCGRELCVRKLYSDHGIDGALCRAAVATACTAATCRRGSVEPVRHGARCRASPVERRDQGREAVFLSSCSATGCQRLVECLPWHLAEAIEVPASRPCPRPQPGWPTGVGRLTHSPPDRSAIVDGTHRAPSHKLPSRVSTQDLQAPSRHHVHQQRARAHDPRENWLSS